MLQPPNAADALTYVPPLDPIAPLRAALRGHYEIEREIGQGAFATVYLARDLKHERKVALKVLNADPTSETGELRFIREIRVLARLQHPNILPLHDSGHVEALLYYVMPFVSGETVRARIDREKQLQLEAACSIAREVAEALAYAHAQGIIHRDIKPENILLSAGHPVLADFGIARIIDVAGVLQLTKTGTGSPGTPAYMSPEQMLGDRVLDGRSDTYSLGCVLFEMLTGKPPFSGKDGFVKRFTEPPPSACALRRDLPSWIDGVLEKALARAPADRYATAQEFVTALCEPGLQPDQPAHYSDRRQIPEAAGAGAATPHDVPSPGALRRDVSPPELEAYSVPPISRRASWIAWARRRPAGTALAIAAVLSTVALAASLRTSRMRTILDSGAPIDTARIAVLPFAEAGAGASGLGATASAQLYDALNHWQGLALVADTRVAQSIAERPTQPLTERDALALARKLGAGKLVWGQASAPGGSPRVGIHLYDVLSGESIDEVVLSGKIDSAAFGAAAIRILGGPHSPAASAGGESGTRSYAALSAYLRGHTALVTFDLAGAEREFRAAASADPDYAAAHLWLAQALAWDAPDSGAEWQDQVAQAAAQVQALSSRDQLIASGLSALANRSYPAACEAYTKMSSIDSLDFVGWFGRGECLSLDDLVVPDERSQSKWRFRSSFDDAENAYRKALQFAPAAYGRFSYARLQNVLPNASTRLRHGFALPPEKRIFLAYPSLNSVGTVGYVPYPADEFATVPPVNRGPALDRNIRLLRSVAETWTRISPRNADAFEALSDALEARSDERPGSMTALDAARLAKGFSSDSAQRLRLAAREVWMRVKRSEFGTARILGDSLLRAVANPDLKQARLLLPLAFLTGKVDLAGRLAGMAGPYLTASLLTVQAPLRASAGQLFAHAALGICGSDTRALQARLSDDIESYVAQEDQIRTRASLTSRSNSMLVPCTSGASALDIPPSRDMLFSIQQAFARKDFALARSLFARVAATQRMQRPADVSLDRTFQEAWLRAAIGDTVGAIRQLDQTLRALPDLSSLPLQDPASVAALPRAMMLRANLAAAQSDGATSKRWAAATAALWFAADPPLKAYVRQMETLAGTIH